MATIGSLGRVRVRVRLRDGKPAALLPCHSWIHLVRMMVRVGLRGRVRVRVRWGSSASLAAASD